MSRAMTEAVSFALSQWQMSEEELEHYLELFQEWLLSAVVVGEFRLLLMPQQERELDIELLQEEFEATSLSLDHLGIPFDELIQDMVGVFYLAAREEPDLQPVLMISLLENIVDQTGALPRLENLMAEQLERGESAVDELKQIRQATEQISAGTNNTNILLKKISARLDEAASRPDQPVKQQITYREATAELDRAELLPQEIDTTTRNLLLDLLIQCFDQNELNTLAFRVNVNPDRLPGNNLDERAMALITHLERRGRLLDLVNQAKKDRPLADWPDVGIEGGVRSLDDAAANELEKIWERLDTISQHLAEPTDSLDAESVNQLKRHYCQFIIDQFEKLTFQGLAPSGTPIALPLDEVYVELKAVARVPEAADTFSAEERRLMLEMKEGSDEEREGLLLEMDALRAQRWRTTARQENGRLQRRSIQQILSAEKERGVVILGDPGSGKTTLLHYLALQAANKFLAGMSRQLPIFVPLAAYDDHLRRTTQDTALGDFLAAYYARWHNLPGLRSPFELVLQDGEALVLLDGLDEVLDTDTRRFVANQVDGFIHRWMPGGSRFALSSRIVGYREAPLNSRLPHVTIVDFGPQEVDQFATQWCLTYELWLAGRNSAAIRRRADNETQALLSDVRSNESLERLAANPLLITMLALLRRNVGKLPDRRIELYERYSRTLIDNWELTRSYGARQQRPTRFEPHQAIAHLLDLALWLQQNKPSGTMQRAELENTLTDIYLRYEGLEPLNVTEKIRVEARQQASNFLQDMRYFAGLLVERGRNAYGFLHLTFQEYFAGRALARMDSEDRMTLLKDHLHDPRWHEPILLCAGQLGVVEGRRNMVNDLVEAILNTESVHESWLHRDTFLAAAIAADNVGLSPTVLDKISSRLQALIENPVPAIQRQAYRGLGKLTQLNHEDSVARLAVALEESKNFTTALYHVREFLSHEACRSLLSIVRAKINDQDGSVRSAAIAAIAPLLAEQPDLLPAITAKLDEKDDQNGSVRSAAIAAIAPLLAEQPDLLPAITAKLDEKDDQNGSVRSAAIAAIAPLLAEQPDLLPAITARLDDQDGDVRSAAIAAIAPLLAEQPDLLPAVTARLDDQDGDVRRAAIAAIAPLLAEQPDLLPAITARLDEKDDQYGFVRSAAIAAIAPLLAEQPDLLPAITAKLDEKDDQYGSVRRAAIAAIAPLLAERPDLLPAITAKLDEKDDQYGFVQSAAIAAIAPLLAEQPDLLPAVTARLDDQENYNGYVRSAAIAAIAPLLAEQPDLLPAITAKLDEKDDQNGSVRSAAIAAIAPLLAEQPDLLPAITAKLDEKDDQNGSVRRAAIAAIAPLLAEQPDLLPAITARLDDQYGFVRSAAIAAIAPLLAEQPDLLPAITAKLDEKDDQNGSVRSAAIAAIAPLLAEQPDLLPAITARLDDQDGDVRSAAIAAIAPLLAEQPDLLPAITARLDDQDGDVRSAAIAAIAPLLAEQPDLLPAITAKLDEKDDQYGSVRSAAIAAIAPLLAEQPDLLPAITAKLDEKDDQYGSVRRAAIAAIAPLLAEQPDLLPAITAKLDEKDDQYGFVRSAAIAAIAPLLAEQPDLLPAITAKLDEKDDQYGFVRSAAIAAIAPLLAEQPDLLPAITAKLDEKDDQYGSVRRAAIEVLIPLLSTQETLQWELHGWLGFISEHSPFKGREIRQRVATALSPFMCQNQELKEQVVMLLSSPAWPARQGAAWALAGMSEGASPALISQLKALLHDTRAEESWPQRLQVAKTLLNHREPELDRRAIAVAIEALDYAIQPWYVLPHSGPDVRRQAAQILGTLDPIYYDGAIFSRLRQVMIEDTDERVRDSAYEALLRLVSAPKKIE